MAIEPKTTREHIISLYGHITGISLKIIISNISTKMSRSWAVR